MTDIAAPLPRHGHASALRPEPDVLPIVSIAGTRGKSTVAWMLSHILGAAQRPYASWLSSGVYVDGELQDGELGPWSRVVLAARYGEIDVAIQELSAPTVVGAGLPEGTYPLLVLTTLCGNNEACLLSPETEMERRALAIATNAVRDDGTIIVNADDYDIIALGQRSSSQSVLYALHPDNPALQRHLEAGGYAAWVDEGWICFGTLHSVQQLISVAAIPATLDGTILFQVQNALAAAAVAMYMGLPSDALVYALSGFEPRPDVQPAACNIVEFNQATILIDAPTQVVSLRMLARGIRHKPHRRTLVASGCFPHLDDEQSREAGRILGDLAGIVLLHGENADDGRMDAIKSGIASATVPPIVLSIPNEAKAIDHLLNTIGEDDVALIIADNPQAVLDHLWPAPVISVDARHGAGKTGTR